MEYFLEDVGVLIVDEVEEESLCEYEAKTYYNFFGVFCYTLPEEV